MPTEDSWIHGREEEGYVCTYVNMAQQTSRRKSKRLSSAKRESQIRMTSGSRNSWDKSNVSQRKAKNWGLMFCSCCQTGTRQTMNTCSWPVPYRQEMHPMFPSPSPPRHCSKLQAHPAAAGKLLHPLETLPFNLDRKIFSAATLHTYSQARKCPQHGVKEAFLPKGTICVPLNLPSNFKVPIWTAFYLQSCSCPPLAQALFVRISSPFQNPCIYQKVYYSQRETKMEQSSHWWSVKHAVSTFNLKLSCFLMLNTR